MNIISRIRKRKSLRLMATFVVVNMVVEIVSPTAAFALTSGPSQPEVQSFEPVSTSDMVDLFSGDFTYNIPLFELPGPDGGYPFNLAYHSGIGMEQEASWVGLGWNINPGALTRQMRGIPDEFNGDKYQYKMDMKPSVTFGVNASASLELWTGDKDAAKVVAGDGKGSLSLSGSVYYNNYKGFGYSVGSGFKFNAINTSVGLNMDSQGGTSVSMDYTHSFGKEEKSKTKMNVGVGLSLSSKAGLSATLQGGYKRTVSRVSKKNEIKRGPIVGGASSTLSCATLAYSTYSPMATTSNHMNISFKFGGDLVGVFTNAKIGGFFNITDAKNRSNSRKAYGLFYAQNREKDGLQDFNRERDKSVHRDDRTLPVPTSTPDFYSFTGQGVGGMFRTFRSDVGNFHDPYTKSTTDGGSFGVEFGVGIDTKHIGLTGTYTHGESEVGKWDPEGQAWRTKFNFKNYEKPEIADRDDYEIAWFGLNGEMVSSELTELDWIGGETPIAAKMERKGTTEYKADDNKYIDVDRNEITLTKNSRKNANLSNRKKRGTVIQQVTNELLLSNTQELISEYKLDYYDSQVDFSNAEEILSDSKTPFSRSTHKAHHFAGFTVNKAGGQRYIYGLPAYNKKQIESTFSVSNEEVDCTPRVDIPMSGSSLDYKHDFTNNFLMQTEIPEYAHSYLLTGIIGNDYIDITDNGITEDDYGYWVKFNYAKIHDDFKWRMPYNGARYNKGSYSTKEDNKGSYVYGQKEIWYLASVETRTHIAVFELNDRMDGLSAFKELASLNTQGTQKLKKINKVKLYSKLAYQDAVANSTLSTLNPIQTVHFKYDYSLCRNVENNNNNTDPNSGNPINNLGGKLTLKEVFITYQGNNRGSLSPYKFNYSTNNPDYDEFAMNRWGNYEQSNNSGDYCSNLDLPYVDQFNNNTVYDEQSIADYRKNNVDANANAWHLTEIETPTGGKIVVDYESDDYAYVQHRKATQMFYINGLKKNETSELTTKTYESSDDVNNRVEFNLEVPIVDDVSYYDTIYNNINSINDVFEKQYLKGLQRREEYYVYFKTYAKLRDNLWDYVNGYAEVKSFGITGEVSSRQINGETKECYTKGFIELKSEDGINPMALAVFQHMRTNEPRLLNYNTKINAKPATSDFEKAARAKSLLSFTTEIPKMFTKFRTFCKKKGFGNEIDPTKSVIKLTTPDGVKFGGGTRVKSVRLSDEFPINATAASYGQVYQYTMQEPSNPKVTISSGVATYEPQIGGDENALRYAESFYLEGTGKNTANRRFVEMPINETYFPGPSVGYAQINVMSLNTYEAIESQKRDDGGGVWGDPTGVSVHKFYTSRDFPTMVSKTERTGGSRRLFIPIPLIGQIEVNKMHRSQGFAVQTNDMHGKPKFIGNYGMDKTGNVMWNEPVNEVEYDYLKKKCFYDGKIVWKLKNKVKTLRIIGTGDRAFDHIEEEKLLGVQYDYFTDQRWSKNYTNTGGLEFNTEILGFFPIPIPWPSVNSSTNEMGLWVTNKVVHRSGILIKTVASDGQSKVTTENLAFDAYTGKPLYTKTKNNWDAPIYGLQDVYNYPAITNLGAQFATKLIKMPTGTESGSEDVTVDTYKIVDSGKKLFPGDELIISRFKQGKKFKATVVSDVNMIFANQHADEGSYLEGGSRIIYCGNSFFTEEQQYLNDSSYTITVVRSGHRNMLNLPVHSVSTLSDPLNPANKVGEGELAGYLGLKNVLNASAVDYRDKWTQLNQNVNPYKNGLRGTTRKYRDLYYDSSRKSSSNVSIDQDGVYNDISGVSIYNYPSIIPWHFYVGEEIVESKATNLSNKDTWRYNSTSTLFDKYGNEVENFDPLQIYSSAKYGYNGTVPLWVSSNAKQNEVLYDGFETYNETGLTNNSDDFLDANNIVEAYSHTGQRSLFVDNSLVVKSELDLVHGKEYVLSAWVKADKVDYSYDHTGTGCEIVVNFYDGTRTTNLGSVAATPTGEIIEGWQQISLQFEVPNNLAIEFTDFHFNSGSEYDQMWVDDLRVFPAEGNMQSYVYDLNSYRLLATLDQNNYASFYYYDEAGNLFLVKKETERGIYTLSESTSHSKETN